MSTSISLRSRQGFTLIELLVAMVLIGIVGAAITRTLLNMERGSRAQSQRVALQGNLRAGAALIPSELRELSASDILIAQENLIQYRAMRGTSMACAATLGTVTLRDRYTFMYRDIDAGRDNLFLFLENDPALMTDDSWIELDVSGAVGGVCPNGDPATIVSIAADMDATELAAFLAGAPVRVFEQMELALYAADGRAWLGARSVAVEANLQPVLGPLATTDGLVFTYLDAANAPTTTIASMRAIQIDLLAESEGAISTGYDELQVVDDGLTARIQLRN